MGKNTNKSTHKVSCVWLSAKQEGTLEADRNRASEQLVYKPDPTECVLFASFQPRQHIKVIAYSLFSTLEFITVIDDVDAYKKYKDGGKSASALMLHFRRVLPADLHFLHLQTRKLPHKQIFVLAWKDRKLISR